VRPSAPLQLIGLKRIGRIAISGGRCFATPPNPAEGSRTPRKCGRCPLVQGQFSVGPCITPLGVVPLFMGNSLSARAKPTRKCGRCPLVQGQFSVGASCNRRYHGGG
jgi:hypothetical protein